MFTTFEDEQAQTTIPITNHRFELTIEAMDDDAFRYRLRDLSRSEQFATIFPLAGANRYMCRVWRRLASEDVPTQSSTRTERLDDAIHWAVHALDHTQHTIDS